MFQAVLCFVRLSLLVHPELVCLSCESVHICTMSVPHLSSRRQKSIVASHYFGIPFANVQTDKSQTVHLLFSLIAYTSTYSSLFLQICIKIRPWKASSCPPQMDHVSPLPSHKTTHSHQILEKHGHGVCCQVRVIVTPFHISMIPLFPCSDFNLETMSGCSNRSRIWCSSA